jgi:hypothetical protein
MTKQFGRFLTRKLVPSFVTFQTECNKRKFFRCLTHDKRPLFKSQSALIRHSLEYLITFSKTLFLFRLIIHAILYVEYLTFLIPQSQLVTAFSSSILYHQQKREEDHGDLKKRRKTNTSPMEEVGGAEKKLSDFPAPIPCSYRR